MEKIIFEAYKDVGATVCYACKKKFEESQVLLKDPTNDKVIHDICLEEYAKLQKTGDVDEALEKMRVDIEAHRKD